jgi:hypothetical protein
LFNPRRFKARPTVAGETFTSRVIILPVSLRRCRASICSQVRCGVGLRSRFGRELRSTSPETPSAVKWVTHLHRSLALAPLQHTAYGFTSTKRCQADILVDVHPVSLANH